ncbi:MAG: 4-(cytidine 5'-diphospho)-2-C-methyl-D-erythritol kinase [Alistipes sp.]
MIRKANCKINIGLDVLRQRDDGYHELATVMVPVAGLFDEVEVTRAAEVSFRVVGMVIDCPVQENLCLRAVRLMQSRYNVGGVCVTLLKRVPFGAGLGGGSSDATAVIMAMNELFELHLPESELIACAATLGSDTAFFVRNTPQFCTGRGEVMTPFALHLSGRTLVLVKPAEGVSTREAYAGVVPHVPIIPLCERLQQPLSTWQQSVKNDFEPSVFAAHPRIRTLKESLQRAGAIYASMSGSGSTLYGIFDGVQDVVLLRRTLQLTDCEMLFVFEL